MAEVDAEHRHAGRAGELGGPQEGAVAAEDEHQLGAVRGAVVRRRPRPGRRPQAAASSASIRTSKPGVAQLLGRVGPPVARSGRATVCATSRTDLIAPPACHGSSIASSAICDRRRRATRVLAQPHEEFHVARRARQRAAHHAAVRQPELGRAPRPRRRPRRPAGAGSRTTPPLPSRSRPTSNCGLTIGTRSPSGRRCRRPARAAPAAAR